ncbi:ATP-binding protein [Microbacterium betulae]|uniref:Sensor-like histidine kinase SenX3 n=1 Tax=Microbacterium betulae TaxID=2981139 RepID=A0AA97I659_9MICO|nr:ATP-binding protein [Microbacterium sp. AB]WOF22277.1 ATP-binding protein [Microbacterium sp. AB]
MPLFESERSPRGRLRVFVRAQLPFLIGMLFVLAITWIAFPDRIVAAPLWAAVTLVGVASLASVAVPWERIGGEWLVLVAVADIVAVAIMRSVLFPALPAVGMLVIFPVLWLAYGFSRPAMVLAVAGTVFVTSYHFVLEGVWPADSTEWANVIAFPALILAVSIVVSIAASHLRGSQARLLESYRLQEEALVRARNSEALIQSILDTVDAGVAFYDRENRPAVSNRIAASVASTVGFDLGAPPFAGENAFEADRTTAIPPEQQFLPRALRGEALDEHLEWIGPPDDQHAIVVSSRPVLRDDGQVIGTVVVTYDVTELADALSLREQFLSTISHELRTPLTSIMGYLDLLQDDADLLPAHSVRYLGGLGNGARSLDQRIRELLAAADVSERVRRRPRPMLDLLIQALEKVRPLAADRDIRLVVQHDSHSRVPVYVDGQKIVHALQEIASNAVKFSPDHSAVRITVSSSKTLSRITVVDEGPGMTRAEANRVFERFYRTQYARDNAVQGFGLGLAVAEAQIKAHGGHIRITSEPGRGTSFTVEVPHALPDVPPGEASGAGPAAGPGSGERTPLTGPASRGPRGAVRT